MKASHLHCLTTETQLIYYQMDIGMYFQTVRRTISIRATLNHLARTLLGIPLDSPILKHQVALWICDPLVALWFGTEP
jgi:hypothetical protein